MIPGIYFSRLRFHLSPIAPLQMPARNKGNTLRGAIGSLLDLVAQTDVTLFQGAPPLGTPAFSNYVAVARPVIVRPPLDEETVYLPGEEFAFEVVLVGKSLRLAGSIYLALLETKTKGLGPARAPCQLTSVEHLDENGKVVGRLEALIEEERQKIYTIRSETLPLLPDRSKLTVRFLTPTHLVFDEERVLPEMFEFHHLAKRLRDRLNALATVYCGGPLQLDFAGLGRRAESVRVTRRDLRWECRERTSSRTGQKHGIGGLIGEFDTEGELTEFLPLLQLGEYLHVGKHAGWGNGWIKIV